MSLVVKNFDPFKELRELEQRFAQWQPALASDTNVTSFVPAVNTREDDKNYYIEIDLPGVKKEDINVELNDNKLTVSGERKHKEEVKKEDYYLVESTFGKFQRTFTLPENVDAEHIEAKEENGVVEIVIPKVNEPDVSKRIEIK
ncbi:Hsp20/alpha crystallin family protein [Galenea microaerophila]